jgi:hypothetical protein
MALLEQQEAAVNAQKERNDKAQLRLENLLYKQAYLAREIKLCKDFTPTEVLAVENELNCRILQNEFVSDLTRRHRESLSKLAIEYEDRQRLRANLSSLKEEYAAESSILDAKRKFLDDIPAKLTAVLTATSDLDQLFSSADPSVGRNRDTIILTARKLPTPLYVLFHSIYTMQISSSKYDSASKFSVFDRAGAEGRWLYKVDMVEGQSAESGFAVDLTLKIEKSGDAAPSSTLADSASVVLRFTSKSSKSDMEVDGEEGNEHQEPSYVTMTVTSLSFHSILPFKVDQIFHCLYPRDTGDAISADATYFLWVQWICGLRPLPSSRTLSYGYSTGSVMHKVRYICHTFVLYVVVC